MQKRRLKGHKKVEGKAIKILVTHNKLYWKGCQKLAGDMDLSRGQLDKWTLLQIVDKRDTQV